MDYSKLSDQEINQLIGKIISRDGLSIIAYNGNAVIHEYSDCGDFKGVCLGWKAFDPCNNPADAWPIIVDNSIGIKKQSNGLWVSSRHGGMYPQYHENPLRAAMIVFLMMQESANVPANSTGSDIR
ncbi:DUF2591 family protein [Citrobacter sp. FDAARGOS_156]|uniref:phage protein NinX family protein n=1 Tax=Citrobacter sp. FDAARGOS_156 TaxID=1702170 RepID=UPI001900037B|nr:phage protein NinX family protein [Citrobacter sp. FDAARGOS_156]MBJ9110049.1 DUF2591 family protein [Citrobacter sp. FDAARGOS_156]